MAHHRARTLLGVKLRMPILFPQMPLCTYINKESPFLGRSARGCGQGLRLTFQELSVQRVRLLKILCKAKSSYRFPAKSCGEADSEGELGKAARFSK